VNTGTPLESGRALRPAAWHEVTQALAITDRERDRRLSLQSGPESRHITRPETLIPFVMLGGNTIARECLLRPEWLMHSAECSRESSIVARRIVIRDGVAPKGMSREHG
jgi:hypothetical protein